MAITSCQRFFPTCYGPEFVANAVREWIAAVGAKAAYIEPGSPWENGYCGAIEDRLIHSRHVGRRMGPQLCRKARSFCWPTDAILSNGWR